MRIGDFDLYSLSDGFFGLDGGAMFGVVPRPLWEKTNPPDDRNRIRLALRPLLIVAGPNRVLVDTGIGNKWDIKGRDIYRIEKTETLDGSLARLRLTPEDITHVVLTHLHFDHAGGATRLDSNGQSVPSFPNARYLIQRTEWEDAVRPNRRSRAAYLPENFLPLEEAGLLQLVNGTTEVMPGIELLHVGGHTRGL
ncbi:MAG: MBL fold metallo-hydrolase, partial [candidate division WOR-3 bacterium]